MSRSRQSGMGAIAAIFILVLFAGLASFMAVLSTTQQVGSALDVQGARAFAAAQSGTEWALERVVHVAAGSTVSATNGSTAVTGSGTAFLTNMEVGGSICISGNACYTISSIASNTSLTLSSAYTGTTGSGLAYTKVTTVCSSNSASPVNTNLGALDTMYVTVSCYYSTVDEQGSLARIYSITSTACNIPTGSSCPGSSTAPYYVERRVTTLVEK